MNNGMDMNSGFIFTPVSLANVFSARLSIKWGGEFFLTSYRKTNLNITKYSENSSSTMIPFFEVR